MVSLISPVMREGAKRGCPMLVKDRSGYDASAWVFTREQIGQKLKEHYQVPKELPFSLLTLVRKLDTLEGNKLLRECRERLRAQAPLRNDAQ